jgi:terminase large subunit-like protein
VTNIINAMRDGALFGKWFKRGLLRGDSWRNWRVLLGALFGLGLDSEAHAIYKQFTGRDDVPTEQVSEAWLICGRRSGKSLVAALIAVFVAVFRDYTSVLAPGEVATIMVIACDKRQARVVLNYINGFFDTIPILSQAIVSRTKESITLTNRVRVEVHVASFRAVRGYSIACAILDECAFFPTGDSASPDEELVNALRPAMATIPGSLLLGISSPYAKRGVLYEAFTAHFGKAGAPALVWKADTRSMNPTVSKTTIAMAYLRDSAAADSEFGANFRSDISGFVSREVVEARIDHGCFERAFVRGYTYAGFVDPSGGSSDSFTLSIAHREGDKAILDCVREVVPPFSPEEVVSEFAQVLKSYGIGSVTGDAFAGLWPRERFLKCGIEYKVSDRTRSEIYLSFLPMLMSANVQLLDNARLVNQLVGLERRTARSGKDSVDHSPGSHDDIANAAAGAVLEAVAGAAELGYIGYLRGLASGLFPEEPEETPADWTREVALQFEMKLAGMPVTGSMHMAETVSPCPQCQGPRVFISGCGLHCNGCGADFANQTDKNPVRVVPSEGPCCGSPLLVRIPGGQTRCQQCGAQSGTNQPKGVSRKDVASYTGGREQMNSVPFLRALGRLRFGGRE